jgi:hypothetical protein
VGDIESAGQENKFIVDGIRDLPFLQALSTIFGNIEEFIVVAIAR